MQKAALQENSYKSIQFLSLENFIQSVTFCPCQCNYLSLAIKNVYKSNKDFTNLVEDDKSDSIFLRSMPICSVLKKNVFNSVQQDGQ